MMASPEHLSPLPIDARLQEITDLLRAHKNLVLTAEPGAGKTTRVPPAVVNASPPLLSADAPNLVLLQPRRVAARAAAERIAYEQRWTLGNEVGYQVRFEKRITARTRLRVLTEGILTRQLLDDPFLENTGCVILDEFHERSIHTDLALAMLREIQQTVRPDLLLLVMSATLHAGPVAAYLGGCPVVSVEGRAFPVDIRYAGVSEDRLEHRVARAVREELSADRPDAGDVLVFLPGVEEIRRAGRELESAPADVVPLHGSLTVEEQHRAITPGPRRKIVLSTNIAETSLTLEGVTCVIDSGLARVASYDPDRGLDRLDVQRVSKASMKQRAGRAGRVRPGRCVRLWGQREEIGTADYDVPEIERIDLASTILSLHAWGKADVRAFNWFERPPEMSVAAAERLLALLGLLTSETAGSITALGARVQTVPAHPRLARLLLAAAESGVAGEGATIAALLSEKDILARRPPNQGTQAVGRSDVLARMDLLDLAERSRFAPYLFDQGIDPTAARQAARARDDMLRVINAVPRAGPTAIAGTREDVLLQLTLLAYPDRVCRRRDNNASSAVMVGGGGVKISPGSTVWKEPFFIAVDARQDPRSNSREALVRIASAVEPAWLEKLFPQSVRTERTFEFDAERGRVMVAARRLYLDLLLEEYRQPAKPSEDASAILANALRPQAAALFARDESATDLLARVALLRRHLPEHPWPAFTETDLADVLTEATIGKTTVAAVTEHLVDLLRARLPYPLDRLLDEHAPATLEVPSGSRIKIQYPANQSPVLAVRLQELFGLADTPRLAMGRAPVLLHLLAPNYRPVQITEDLRSFWAKAYFDVRKDLRARYPKHKWPDDPLAAAPEAKGRPRRT